ncbi:fibronectin type III domain-containing protein [Dyadobacter psychrotolerans]|uniref:T9SS type A sorting domain-containing protein n=1 Tax=Dyadobacter psychrotolerans TaxID=2541721 RepID=A0A4R5DF45_9BACT|nr:fibronectin type III domain-containing protein [Dyadobacter psychrotolerans]TDE10560.1 T9SS type A sorting domain-containing protein [Dyadobacter psychrotolerans]
MKNFFSTLKITIYAVLLFSANSFSQTVLPAPTGLAGTAPVYNRVELSWKDNSGELETGFDIFRDGGLGNNFVLIGSAGKNVTTYQDLTVSANTLYYYRVRAKSATQNSSFSNDVQVNTPIAPPVAPGNLAAALLNANTIRITWDGNNDGSTTFYLERANMSAGGAYSQIAIVPYNRTLSFDDTGLSAGTQYCYRVRAHNTSGESGYSNSSCATTTQVVPVAPGRLTATSVSSSGIDLAWADLAANETGYEIERGTTSTGTFQKIADLGPNAASYQDRGLNASSQYCYRVRAKNAVGNSEYAGPVCATTGTAPIVRPAAPTVLTATVASGSQINLSWTDNAINEDGFELEFSLNGTSYSKLADLPANTVIYQHTGLSPTTRYWYKVRAKNAGGYSDYSNVADATTAEVAPVAPARLTATPVSNTQIDLSWADVSSNETGFELEISLNGTTFSKLADLSANTITYQATGLTTLTKYWFRIKAKNNIGSSGFSNVAEATTFDIPPAAPTDLAAATISSSQINLTWKDVSTNETGFELQRSTDGTNFTKITDLPANTTTYQNTGLNPATQYWFRVRAINTANPSPFSNIASATTMDVAPVAPARLTAVAITYEQVNLSWADISGNETGFQIQRSTDGVNFTKVADVAANVTTYENKGLNALTKYYFRIFAFNAIGNSPLSNVAEVTTPQAPIPDAPRDLTAIPLDFDLIQLRWSPLSANAVEVIIERSTRPDQGFVQIGKQAASIIQFADREILDVADYYYRIKATNAAGSSLYSNVAKVEAFSIITGTEPVASKHLIYAFDKTLHIKLAGSQKADITLVDIKGAKLKQFISPQTSQTDLHDLAPGIYIVLAKTDKQVISEKIILFQ